MPNKKSEIEFEFKKIKRPPPKGVLQKMAREYEEDAKEKKANKGRQTPSASQKMQNKKREEAIKRIENKNKNKDKDKKRNTFAGGVGESNRQKSMRVNMKAGGALKAPANPGLKKLPTKVRNKMGYMKAGGKVGYSKGGIVDRQYLKGR